MSSNTNFHHSFKSIKTGQLARTYSLVAFTSLEDFSLHI